MKKDYEIRVFYSEQDKEWVAFAPELRGCSALGSTPQEAIKELDTAMDLWLESRKEMGWNIPKPVETEVQAKFLMRMPKALKRELTIEARREGVSLNQWVLHKLSQGSYTP